jgi:SAM-dependent methyltransferase
MAAAPNGPLREIVHKADRRNAMAGYGNAFRAALRGHSWRMLMVVPGSLRRRLVRHVPRPLLYGLSWVLMLGMPDRVLLDRRIIPALIDSGAKTVLSIGVAYYNAHHPSVFAARGVELWTIDLDQQTAIWGSPGRHITGDALDLALHLAPETFDAVILNGVLGYGIDGARSVDRALRSIAAILKPGGRLVIGWNHDKTSDPTPLPAAKELFRPCALLDGAAHLVLAGSTMVYDFLERA